MKTFLTLLAAAFIALAAIPAQAGWNLRHNDDGTTEWVRESGSPVEEITYPVGSVTLTLHFDDISTAATRSISSPISNAKVSYIQSAVGGSIASADAIMTFRIGNTAGSTAVTGFNVGPITGSSQSGLITFGSSEVTGQTHWLEPTSNNEIERNEVVLVHTDGGSTNVVPATITITFEPR